jgi:hypothetical protein
MQFLRRLTVTTRPALVFVAMIVLAAQPDGCAPTDPPGSHSETIHSCSPNYIDKNKLGKLSVQQRGRGSAIQWGAYPSLDAGWYHVVITIDGKVVDGANQFYAPHGSLKAEVPNKHGRLVPTYTSGQIFKITGTSYASKGGKVVQKFFIKCRLK